MVELVVDRLEYCFYLREVHYPARVWVNIASYKDSHHKTVAMQAGAFVALRDIWQAVGGFKGELFINFHVGFS